MADPRIRQIKIKTGIVKRLAKEEIAYITEAKQQEEKVEKLKAEAGDDYVIKKQMEVLQESRMMIPDCHRRLAVAHADLLQLLKSVIKRKQTAKEGSRRAVWFGEAGLDAGGHGFEPRQPPTVRPSLTNTQEAKT
uniref:Tubulin-specific chaperone A n=1 Tax=Anabas testudineus TaxID=64144 RepID=A0AAQ6IFG7_ANATE